MHHEIEEKRLVYKCEVLRARLEIRDFFLSTAVRDVYENIGQVLSLVRMQLALPAGSQTNAAIKENISASGELVAQTIGDLRKMCRNFYPDNGVLIDGGFTEALNQLITLAGLSNQPGILVRGITKVVSPGLLLITFRMLQEILLSIKKTTECYESFTLAYLQKGLMFTIIYKGELFNIYEAKHSKTGTFLSLDQITQLIQGSLNVKKGPSGFTRIVLKIPLKLPLYE